MNGWPRVTSILKFFHYFDQYAFVTDERYMRRGRHVHMACHLLGAGETIRDEPSWVERNEYHAETCRTLPLAPELAPDEHKGCIRLWPYIAAYRRFLAAHRFEMESSEIEVRHPQLHYTGHPDQIGILDGEPSLIDIKTGSCPDAVVKLQTVAYEMALGQRLKRFGLQLRLDGTYRLWPCTDFRDRDKWTYLVSAYLVAKNDGAIQ